MRSFGLLFILIGCAACSPQRIVGGSDAYKGQYPWQASIEFRSSATGIFTHVCGGTLFKANRIVTAAQCVYGRSPSEYHVVLGQHQRLHTDGTEQYFNVTHINVHPSYNGNTNLDGFANDIAVLELDRNADLSHPQVSLLQLASMDTDFTGLKCEISGWGKVLGTDSSLPDVLQGVQMTQINNTQCASYFTEIQGAEIGTGHICSREDEISACNGDTGGPMVCDGRLAGVYSWVVSPCRTTFPSVFTRVSAYREWLNSQ